jgi:hypothetical protein
MTCGEFLRGSGTRSLQSLGGRFLESAQWSVGTGENVDCPAETKAARLARTPGRQAGIAWPTSRPQTGRHPMRVRKRQSLASGGLSSGPRPEPWETPRRDAVLHSRQARSSRALAVRNLTGRI